LNGGYSARDGRHSCVSEAEVDGTTMGFILCVWRVPSVTSV